MRTSIHQPNLSTIRRVEEKIKRKKYFRSRNQMFLSLGKSIMYPTMTTVLDYLEKSNKISFNKSGSIVWIFKDSHRRKKLGKGLKPTNKR